MVALIVAISPSALLLARVIFWLAAAGLLWVWIGFPLVLQIAVWVKKLFPGESVNFGNELPSVTILVTVHNEEHAIDKRIQNCLELNYPADKLEIMVASDNSTDATDAIVESFASRGVRLVRSTGRGKTTAQNQAVPAATGEIVIFTDADTSFPPEFVREAVAPFSDPRIGCVTGKVVWTNRMHSESTRTAGFYWIFEHYLWKLENEFLLVPTASGPCMAFRKSLFKPMEPYYGDDSILPLDVIEQDYRVFFQGSAIAFEEYFPSARAEMRARVRMSLRSFSGTISKSRLYNPVVYGSMTVVLLSHKILRWLTGYFLIACLLASLALVAQPIYRILLSAQIVFYACAVGGYLLQKVSLRLPLVSTCYSFCAVNVGIFIGVTKAMLGRRMYSYRT